MEEEENAPSRSTPEEKKGAKNDDGRTRRLRPFRSTPEEEGGRKTTAGILEGFAPWDSLYGGGGKRPFRSIPKEKRKRKTTAGVLEGFAPGGIRKSKICSAEVVRFASNPPRQRGEGGRKTTAGVLEGFAPLPHPG